MAQISRTSPQRVASYSAEARADLADISDQTAEQWGDEQAEAYSDFLLDTVQNLADAPRTAPRVPDLDGVQVYVARWKNARQGHRVFFEETPTGIVVLRILHTAMDWQARLQTDSRTN